MVDQQRDESGRFVGDADADDVFEAMEPGEPMVAKEIAAGFDVTKRTVINHLNALAEAGRIRKKKTGARSAVWIRPVETANGDDSRGHA